MRIVDILLDRLCETRLFEMAFERKRAINNADSLCDPISMHMIKVLMFGQATQRQHWLKEIDTWLRSVQRHILKTTKKPLPFKDLMYLLHEGPLEHVWEVQDRMNELYSDYPQQTITQPDAAVLHKQLEELYSRVCYDISEKKFKTISDYLV
jgi:hypothetical protein